MATKIHLDLSVDEARLLQEFIAHHYHRDADRDSRKILGSITERLYRGISTEEPQLTNNGDLA